MVRCLSRWRKTGWLRFKSEKRGCVTVRFAFARRCRVTIAGLLRWTLSLSLYSANCRPLPVVTLAFYRILVTFRWFGITATGCRPSAVALFA